ncbi:hypothetical protein [Kitasatospora aureofaciens]|uniref:hypothetical protein n=1 Tax=Kitasatospora aureofaciens TaxID=1894 RepID=UPI001C487EC7|nr:hypothetical protein [Kitasatospora aureofaciens]MBV6699363.1 hypothetical protein [Kitasatospora aureofaciens]
MSAATASGKPHPWTVDLVNIDPGAGRRSPRQVSQENSAATRTRMLMDEHRSNGGRCVRCDTAWPCTPAADAMYGSAS